MQKTIPIYKLRRSLQFHLPMPFYRVIHSPIRQEDTNMAENDDLEARIKTNKEKYGDFVRRLYADDEEAWMEIYKKVILAALRYESVQGHNLGRIAKDLLMTEDDVYHELYVLMIKEKKLDLYRYECNFYYWLRHYYVRDEIILKNCPRTKNTTNTQTGEKEKKRIIISMDHQKLESIADSQHVQQENGHDAPDWDDITSSAMSKKEIIKIAFAKLFKSNPKGATILLLHKREGLTAKAICGVLGLPQDISHINHVDNAYRTADDELQNIIRTL